MLVTDNGLTWKQERRRIYVTEGGTGKYVMTANTGDRRKCRLWFFKDDRDIWTDSYLLSTGRIRDLMRVAEIHNVTNP